MCTSSTSNSSNIISRITGDGYANIKTHKTGEKPLRAAQQYEEGPLPLKPRSAMGRRGVFARTLRPATSLMTLFAAAVANAVRLLLLLLVVLAPATIGVDANSYTACPNNALTLRGLDLTQSTFKLPPNCALTIADCRARQLSFSAATQLTLIIRNLDCGDAPTTTDSYCINFLSSVTGAVDIDNVTRTWSGTTDASFTLVSFTQPCALRELRVTNMRARSNVSAAQMVMLYLLNIDQDISGHGPGSVLNVSLNSITGAASDGGSGGGVFSTLLRIGGTLSAFDRIDISGNTLVLNATSVSSTAQLTFILFLRAITLTGTESSALTMRGNSMRGTVVQAAFATVCFLRIADAVNNVTALIVDGCDITNVNVTASNSFAAMIGVLLQNDVSGAMTTVGALVTLNNILLGGIFSCAGIDGAAYGFGPFVLSAYTLRNISILISNSHMDYGGGVSATGATTPLVANMLEFRGFLSDVPFVQVQNCSLRGRFVAPANAQVRLLHIELGLGNVGRLTVDTCDMSAVNISSLTQAAALMVLAFHWSAQIRGVGAISIANVALGGQMTYVLQPDDETPTGCCVAYLRSPIASLGSVTVTNATIDFSAGGVGLSTSGTAQAAATVLQFGAAVSNIARIAVQQCAIRGTFASAAGGTQIRIVSFLSDVAAVPQLSVRDSGYSGTATTLSGGGGFVAVELVQFDGGVDGCGVVIANLDCGTTGQKGDCILFNGAVTSDTASTTIDINNVTRTWAGVTESGNSGGSSGTLRFNVVRFVLPVTAGRMHIAHVVGAALNLAVTRSDTLELCAVIFTDRITGSGVGGSSSILNVSSNRVVGSVQGAGAVTIYLLTCLAGVTNFAVVEASANSLVVTVSAGAGDAGVAVAAFSGAVTSVTHLLFNENSIKGSYSSSGAAGNTLLHIARFDSTVSAVSFFACSSNSIAVTSASSQRGFVAAYNAEFTADVSGTESSSSSTSFSADVHVSGAYTSSSSYVCIGVAAFNESASLSAFSRVMSSDISRSAFSVTAAAPFPGTWGAADVGGVFCGDATCRNLDTDMCRASFESERKRCHSCNFSSALNGARATQCVPEMQGIFATRAARTMSTTTTTTTTTWTSVCECGYVNNQADCTASHPACSWMLPPRNVQPARAYCSPATLSGCIPITCQSIQDPIACTESGCSWNSAAGECAVGECFSFFLPGFLPLPIVLAIVGILKDVLVLCIIGIVGDRLQKVIDCVRRWCCCCCRRVRGRASSVLEERFDSVTVYLLDDRMMDIRDDGDEKDALAGLPFEEYVEQVMDHVFVVDGNESSGVTTDAVSAAASHIREGEVIAAQRRALYNSVAFALYDQRLYIDLSTKRSTMDREGEGDEEEQGQHPPGATEIEPSSAASLHSPAHGDDARTVPQPSAIAAGAAASSNSRNDNDDDQVDDDDDDDDDSREAPLLNNARAQGTARIAPTTASTTATTIAAAAQRIHIAPFELLPNNTSKLQQRVDRCLRDRASYRAFYSQSRSKLLCAAAVVHDLVTPWQLVYYSLGLLYLMGTTFYTVLLNSENFSIVKQLADPTAGCSIGGSNNRNSSNVTIAAASLVPPNNGSGSGSSNTSATVSAPSSSPGTPEIMRAAFFLLAWRVCNSSAWSTSCLVLLKVVRGVLRGRNLDALSLSERLPILSLMRSRTSKVLFLLFVLLLAPFVLVGPLYGVPSGTAVPALVPLGAGAGALLLQALSLRIIRWCYRRCNTANNHSSNRDHSATTQQQPELIVRKNNDSINNTGERKQRQHQRTSKWDDEIPRRRGGASRTVDDDDDTASEARTVGSADRRQKEKEEEEADDASENVEERNERTATQYSINASIIFGGSNTDSSLLEKLPSSLSSSAVVIESSSSYNLYRPRNSLPSAAAVASLAVRQSLARFTSILEDGDNSEQQQQQQAVGDDNDGDERFLRRFSVRSSDLEMGAGNPDTDENGDDASARHESKQQRQQQQQYRDRELLSMSPARRFFNALIGFLLTQEFAVVVIALSLQISTNVTCLMQYRNEFALQKGDMSVLALDYKSRKLECMLREFETDVSVTANVLSSFLTI